MYDLWVLFFNSFHTILLSLPAYRAFRIIYPLENCLAFVSRSWTTIYDFPRVRHNSEIWAIVRLEDDVREMLDCIMVCSIFHAYVRLYFRYVSYYFDRTMKITGFFNKTLLYIKMYYIRVAESEALSFYMGMRLYLRACLHGEEQSSRKLLWNSWQ
jgi:hypothetical protein